MKKTFLATLVAATLFGATAVQAATITPLNRDEAGAGLNDPTPATPLGNNPGTSVGEQRRIVYQFAADLWGAVLQSNVETRVAASFQPLACEATSGVLGSAGPYYINRDFDGAQIAGAWYHSALANAIAGVNLNVGPDYVAPDDIEINSRFNANLGSPGCLETSGWYYGLDGNTPAGRINFLDVVMHEIGHGLGFSGFLNKTTGALANFDGTPRSDVYTHFAYDNVSDMRFDAAGMSDAVRATTMMTPGRLVWDGATVNAQAPVALDTLVLLTFSGTLDASYEFGTASFGAVATPANFSGDVVLANDGAGADPNDACEALPAGSLTGKVALVNRGACGFESKALNAENAGAKAVIIANVATSNAAETPPGMAEDPAIVANVPTLSLGFSNGNAVKAALPGVAVSLGEVAGRLAGADVDGRVRLYAPTVVAGGSTFSHYDTAHMPNALMEPAINADLDANLRLDLTPGLFKDLGWVLNTGNGKMGATGTCDTRVPVLTDPGMIAGANLQAADKLCRTNNAGSASGYRTCISAYVNQLNAQGLLSPRTRAAINRCAR